MSRRGSTDQPGLDLIALEKSLERARGALACPYTCADEFEAAVIRAQRARGAFDPPSVTRFRLLLTLASAAAAGAVLALIVRML